LFLIFNRNLVSQNQVHADKNTIHDNQTIVIVGWQDIKMASVLVDENQEIKQILQPLRKYARRRFRNRR